MYFTHPLNPQQVFVARPPLRDLRRWCLGVPPLARGPHTPMTMCQGQFGIPLSRGELFKCWHCDFLHRSFISQTHNTHRHTGMHRHTYIHTQTQKHTQTRTDTETQTHMHTHRYTQIHTYTRAHIHEHIHTHRNTQTHKHTHTDTDTCRHKHI